MLKHFISLEWKSFFRSASFNTNLIIKILMVLGALYFIFMFLALGVGAYYLIDKAGLPPFETINKLLIYYFAFDLILRYFGQKMPIINIKPLLLLPFKKNKIVNYALGKTAISFFNIYHLFFFIPFSVILLKEGHDPVGILTWNLGIMCLIYINNFINVFLNDRDIVVIIVGTIIASLGFLHFKGYFDITAYTFSFFQALYAHWWLWLIPLILLIVVARIAYNYFSSRMYLDAGLASKQSIAATENMDWLNRFGKIATFLKNDIKLIKRNKRSRSTIFMSILFLFYGFLFFTGSIEAYDNDYMKIFAGIFVSGGFLFTFGQFVPSWDSSYYPLMMSQNIKYKEYLASKWWLIVIATAVSAIVSAFYLYFGWKAYAAVVVGAIYNMGVNSHLVMLGGAFVKTPIDLTSGKKAFGDKKAFNMKTLLLTIPKLLLPIVLYAVGDFIGGNLLGFALVALAGLIGFAFRDYVFGKIENVYKAEKYKTIAAYKQNN